MARKFSYENVYNCNWRNRKKIKTECQKVNDAYSDNDDDNRRNKMKMKKKMKAVKWQHKITNDAKCMEKLSSDNRAAAIFQAATTTTTITVIEPKNSAEKKNEEWNTTKSLEFFFLRFIFFCSFRLCDKNDNDDIDDRREKNEAMTIDKKKNKTRELNRTASGIWHSSRPRVHAHRRPNSIQDSQHKMKEIKNK